MIDLELYRCRVGFFNGQGFKRLGNNSKKGVGQFMDFSAFNPYNRPASIKFCGLDVGTGSRFENLIHSPLEQNQNLFLLLFYIYFVLTLIPLMLSCILASHSSSNDEVHSSYEQILLYMKFSYCDLSFTLPLVCLFHIKIGYFCLVSSIFLKYICLGQGSMKRARKYYIGSSRSYRILAQLLLFILVIKFLLIGIVNPSLLNPGPSSLNVCYQNVQGLIPFSQLDKSQPSLDKTKYVN